VRWVFASSFSMIKFDMMVILLSSEIFLSLKSAATLTDSLLA
jgi:hypothetical protein